MGITHKIVEQHFDEDSIIEKEPIACSQAIVEGKNLSARSLLNNNDHKNNPILTADTLVFTPNKEIVGKPRDHDHSRQLLKEFSETFSLDSP